MKPNRTKCIWTAVIAAVAVCMTMSTAHVQGAALGQAYISNVVPVGSYCAKDTQDGHSNDFKWDVQAGGTYDVTLSGVTDCASQGAESSLQVIIFNGTPGPNIGGQPGPFLTANQADTGVYTFRVTLTTQCQTMAVRYCTSNGAENTGVWAQDYDNVNNVPAGSIGHLRTATFDGDCNVTGVDLTCQSNATPTPPPTASITACNFYHNNANGTQDPGT